VLGLKGATMMKLWQSGLGGQDGAHRLEHQQGYVDWMIAEKAHILNF
jgi:hypothetical protein|tara:strand:- start:18 stop:158 length:141 start_codon:yes stop_codon:yes gene_type:complete